MKSVTNQSLEGYIMIIEPMIVTDKIGRSIVLRNAEDKESHGFNRG
ncbi:hypothetical protein HMPREF2738_01974, partial [Clostridiales bacterium KLE1615]